MAKLSIVAGTTSKTVKVFIRDSSSTTGAGLTGLTSASSGLTAYYIREGAASATAITLTTETLGTWTSSGFVAVDGTNMPGLYELGLPNAAIASGAKSVVVFLKGATNMAPVLLEIELTAVDNQDATRGGMTALPNANAGASGGVYLLGAALTEAYRTNGATGSIEQLLYEILGNVVEASISGTTKTVKKIDHTTTATTYTLNSATVPTSVTRAS